ncbi:MAG: hypothetical protein N2561_09800 [Bacteroidetes bacterium]|nr:hypothetical protein [Rhodothermia bacterium]MCS7155224.1 hypothetical protein [Bacteroidota bacterium]MCX7907809.1 hypothetical protein [Bacteroidota bacterium]MDW8138628.1 hypothetical protein [Bacteroidota bacterium]MDW8284786.1 hypothetical protein [Bacteroidota bacterium]
MGQQQLLLLVLGTVIVGTAIVVGIQAFSANAKKANQDAMLQDLLRLATDAQAWVKKPTEFGGGGGRWNGLTIGKLVGKNPAWTADTNANGIYKFESTPSGDASSTDVTLVGENRQENNRVKVTFNALKIKNTVFENIN